MIDNLFGKIYCFLKGYDLDNYPYDFVGPDFYYLTAVYKANTN